MALNSWVDLSWRTFHRGMVSGENVNISTHRVGLGPYSSVVTGFGVTTGGDQVTDCLYGYEDIGCFVK